MAGWPKEIHGHVIARKVDFRRGGESLEEEVLNVFQCVNCGLQFEGPDDPRLQAIGCDRLGRSWMP